MTPGHFGDVEECLASIVPHSGVLVVETIDHGVDQTCQVDLHLFVTQGDRGCGQPWKKQGENVMTAKKVLKTLKQLTQVTIFEKVSS